MLDLFFLSTLVIFINSCASISPPSGGPRDEKAPALNTEKSIPKNNSINFRGRIIELTFDEFISAPTIAEQLLITPLEDNPYKLTQRKNKLILTFEKDFQANTTYTFNFRDAVKDITEGNIAKNLILAFSTGPFLDSIFVSGKVNDLLTNKAQENILVSLYKKEDTLSPLNSKPVYFTKTSAGGDYIIKNIKQGMYALYAIDDYNKDLLLNDREKLAYVKSINLDTSLGNINLALSTFDNKPPKIKNKKSSGELYLLSLSEGVEDVSITMEMDTTKKILYAISKDSKTINIYNTYNSSDSIPIKVQLTDSSGKTAEESIKIIFTEGLKKGQLKESLTFEILPFDRKLNPGDVQIQLIFNKPVLRSDLKKIIITGDTVSHKIAKENIAWKNNTTLEINKKINVKDSVILIIEEGAFTTLDSSNKSQSAKFQIKEEEDYGKISGAIKTKEENIIIELLDNTYKSLFTISNKKTFSFNYLPPGSYYIKVSVDENKNGRWDTLDLQKGTQPEPVYFYKDKIELRANWEVQDIVVQF